MRLLPLLLLCACAVVRSQTAQPQASPDYQALVTDPRDAWQKPDRVIAALSIAPTEVIASIEEGTGYFGLKFAKLAQHVYEVDYSSLALKRASRRAPRTLSTILSTRDDPKLPVGELDTIFICDRIRFLQNRAGYYLHLLSALKPGGRIVVVDRYKVVPPGLPPSERFSRALLTAELRAGGFRLVQDLDILPYQYFLVFQR
jgi:SAM-dependent methyltransferase